MRILSILLLVLLIGCATKPTLKPETSKTKDKQKMMFYKPPEEIWPDDFKPAPNVCGSPFTGKLIAR